MGRAKNDLLDEQMFPGIHDPAMKLLTALRKDPLDFPKAIARLAASGHPEVASSFESMYSTDGSSEIWRQNQVHSLTVEELFEQERAIPDQKRKAANSHAAQSLGELLTYGPIRQDWMCEPVYRHTTHRGALGLVMVDLKLPDYILKTQFQEWLVEMRTGGRQRHEGSSKHKGPSRAKWIAMGLLPCIDLLLWASEQDKEISMLDLAFAIHKGDVNKEDSMRKTTVPLATSLLQGDHRARHLLHVLLAESASEMAEPERARRRLAKRISNRKK